MRSYLYDIKQSKVRATTFDRDECTFKYHIEDGIGKLNLSSIKPNDIQKLLLEKSRSGLSKSSVKKIHDLLGEFFRYAIAIREITNNPMDMVKMPYFSRIEHEKKEMVKMPNNDDAVKTIRRHQTTRYILQFIFRLLCCVSDFFMLCCSRNIICVRQLCGMRVWKLKLSGGKKWFY